MPASQHVGKAGQLVAMSEFLLRGYNVAMPEVDTGDDIFVVEDRSGELWRVQVKTVYGKSRGAGRIGTIGVGWEQLADARAPDLIYVFAFWLSPGKWDFAVISREELYKAHETRAIGRLVSGRLLVEVVYDGSLIQCGGVSFEAYRNDWRRWPVVS